MASGNHPKPPRIEGWLGPGGPASPSNALVVSSDRPTRLESALKAFRDVLTDEERERLRDEMAVSRDASQVMAFTAGLDLVDPNRRGRSIATRLHSILQTVLQFSEVVGIYVSSHPEIAALVWGSVRLAFTVGYLLLKWMTKDLLTRQVLANFTSFFQTFSDLLNGFDTLTPQFNEYQILFPDSVALRNSVYDFHSAIISCCTQVISSTRRTWPQQAWASLTSSFDSEIRPRVAEIREKAELVKGQAALAKAQDDSRRQAKLAAELRLREEERTWNSLLLKLFPYDHESGFIQARAQIHRGTAEWIFSTKEFCDWHESADSSVLNISGKIGSGKTLLTASVVGHVLQELPPNCSISYVFIRFDDSSSRSADMILRSLVFQALSGRRMRNRLRRLLEKSASISFERHSLLSLLCQSISLLEKTFLVVDGLDQCPQQEQRSLLQAFTQLIQMSSGDGAVKILIAVRESMAAEVDQALTPTKRLRVGLADTNADLARYAEEILAEKRNNKELVVGDEAIMTQIMDKLRTDGEGMFLWVFLTIEDICSCPTDNDIRQTLEILPRKLSDTFNRALGRILSSQSSSIVDLVQRTFKWVATVQRPVTRWELGEALGVKILQKSSIKDQTVNGTERLPGWCENLVQIEPGDETVRFFHHSIKTHLLDVSPDVQELGAFHVDLKAWDHEVGEVCFTYLNFSDFQRALTRPSPDTDGFYTRQIATSSEGRSIPAAVNDQAIRKVLPERGRQAASRILRRILQTKKSGEGFQVREPEDGPRFSEYEFFSDHPFLVYATNFCLHHSFHFQASTTKTWKLWEDQMTKSILEDDKLWNSFGQPPPGLETFDLEAWLRSTKTFRVKPNLAALHKAVIFADFIGHRPLMHHALQTIEDHRDELTSALLQRLLSSRRVFQFPLERQGYIRDENSHHGLISLVAEFVACGGSSWPPSTTWGQRFSSCNYTCEGKLLHWEIRDILTGGRHFASDRPWLQVFAKIVVLKLTEETSNAIETYTKSKNPCIHEIRTRDGKDIIDTILEIGGSSSFEFGGWVLDLHENCVDGRRYNHEDRCRKLQAAIKKVDMLAVEFYLQEFSIPRIEDEKEEEEGEEEEEEEEEEEGDCGAGYDLLNDIVTCPSLRQDFRSQAVSIAIPRIAEGGQKRAYEELKKMIVSGDWDIVVALSSHGVKLVDSQSHSAGSRPWFQLLDDILSCSFQPVAWRATWSCSQGWVTTDGKARLRLYLCARHKAKAKEGWNEPYPPEERDGDRQVFEALHDLVHPATT